MSAPQLLRSAFTVMNWARRSLKSAEDQFLRRQGRVSTEHETYSMKLKIWLSAFVTIILPSVALAENTVPPLPVPAGAAMILNAGSVDAAGYRIVVLPSGKAIAVDGAGRGQGQLPGDLADRFFRDLTTAMPLSQLLASACTTTATALLPTFVTFRGERSTDVNCRGNDKSSALSSDVQAIALALYVANYRVRAMRIIFGASGQPAPPAVQPQPATPPSYPSGGYGHMGY